MKTKLILSLFVLFFGMVSCEPATEVVLEATSAPSSTPRQVLTDLPATPEPVTDPLTQKAISDLAERLGLNPNLIHLVDKKSVTWPDASLGCPQPGMMYAQVLTEGYLIRLEAKDQVHEYHTDSSGEQVILCEKPELPVFPVTPGEIDDGEPWVPVD